MAIAPGSEDTPQNSDIPHPLPENPEGSCLKFVRLYLYWKSWCKPAYCAVDLQYARLDASGAADQDHIEQSDVDDCEFGQQGD